jgi:predicted alpha/beta superfamily hydrolase
MRCLTFACWLLAACSQTPSAGTDALPDRHDSTAPDVHRRDSAPAADTAAGSKTTVLHVHYPAGTQTLAVRGSAGPLSWTLGVVMSPGAQDTWTFASNTLKGTVEWKPLLGDKVWALGPNYHVTEGQTVDVYPHFTVGQGKVSKLIPAFASGTLGNTRDIWAYLPPTYLENSTARLPVVYMHDGQNLFDPALAFGGNPWMADKAIDAAAASGTCASGAACTKDSDCGSGPCQTFREAIVIGVDNTADRIAEYTPVVDATEGGGKGDLYLKMLVTELKPKVDAMLRTRPEPENTAMIGSSLGGLISAHAGVTEASTFGLIGAMSPSTWWADAAIITEVQSSKGPSSRALRVYVDSGDAGVDNDDVANTNLLAAAYLSIGYVEGQDFHHLVAHGDQHSEVYWAKRLPGALAFVLGPR